MERVKKTGLYFNFMYKINDQVVARKWILGERHRKEFKDAPKKPSKWWIY